MTRIAHTIAIIALIALTVGCESPTSPNTQPRHSASETDNGLQMTVSTAKASYGFGEDIQIWAKVTNVSDEPIELDFNRGRPARYSNLVVNVKDDVDFAVFVDGDGEQKTLTLNPGKSFSYSFLWNQDHRIARKPVERGWFEVIAFCGLEDWTLRSPSLHLELK